MAAVVIRIWMREIAWELVAVNQATDNVKNTAVQIEKEKLTGDIFSNPLRTINAPHFPVSNITDLLKEPTWFICILMCCVLVTLVMSTLCNPLDHSPPGSSVHGIFPGGILEWVAFRSPRDLPCILIVPSNMRLKKLRAISDDRLLVFWLIQLSWWRTSWLRKRIKRRTGLCKEKINRVLDVWSLRDFGFMY